MLTIAKLFNEARNTAAQLPGLTLDFDDLIVVGMQYQGQLVTSMHRRLGLWEAAIHIFREPGTCAFEFRAYGVTFAAALEKVERQMAELTRIFAGQESRFDKDIGVPTLVPPQRDIEPS